MSEESLWRCPVCGQRFVTRNMPHSCAVVGLDRFFDGAAPELRELFDLFVAAVGEPVVVNATTSRIALQARMRFAGIDRPRRSHLVANFVLTRPVESERFARVDYIPPYYYVHRLRLQRPEDVDAELREWLAEAYQVGEQRHVSDRDWPRQRVPPEWVRVPRGAGP
jgi:endogenous inhibitor of DNA gyrase (YacG/DUF329 family)